LVVSRLLLVLRRLVIAVAIPIAVGADSHEPAAVVDRGPFAGLVRVPEDRPAAISAHENA
jgi:hypothetical protein